MLSLHTVTSVVRLTFDLTLLELDYLGAFPFPPLPGATNTFFTYMIYTVICTLYFATKILQSLLFPFIYISIYF